MVAELKAGRETLAADEAEVARLKVELAGKKGTPTAQAALRERLTELQATGAKLVAQEEVAQRAVRGVEKEAAALCALLDCEPTPILQDQPGATRQRLAAIEQHAPCVEDLNRVDPGFDLTTQVCADDRGELVQEAM